MYPDNGYLDYYHQPMSFSYDSYGGAQPLSWGAMRPLVVSQTSEGNQISSYDQPPSVNDVRGPQAPQTSSSSVNGYHMISDDAESQAAGMSLITYDFMRVHHTFKRPPPVWALQLHKRFVDAVEHLCVNHAVPKRIMQLMNVEGLTLEHLATHLQTYKLYIRRVPEI